MGNKIDQNQKAQLDKCEAIIERGLKTFYEVGAALLEIRDKRLYREHFTTFEEYCRNRWDMSKTHANRLIGSAGVITNLAPIGVIPENESQARALSGLKPDDQREAWDCAVAWTIDGKPTAEDILMAVKWLALESAFKEDEKESINEGNWLEMVVRYQKHIEDSTEVFNYMSERRIRWERAAGGLLNEFKAKFPWIEKLEGKELFSAIDQIGDACNERMQELETVNP